jgi:leucyl aminopeptidase
MSLVTEIFIAYNDGDLKTIKIIKKFSCKPLNKEGARALKKKVTDEFDFNYPLNRYRSFDHTFNNGSKIYVLLLERNLSTYEVNEALLDAFKSAYNNQRISYNIQALDLKDQARCARSLTALEKITKFQIPTFGKRQNRVKVKDKLITGFYTNLKSEKLNRIMEESLVLGNMNNHARELCYLPPNKLDPKLYIEKIQSAVKNLKDVDIEVIDVDQLKDLKANLFLAVAQADLDQGCGIVKLIYKPKSKKRLKRICLIGKGVTYDSGGLDLKTDGSLEGMQRDMTGSAIALSSFMSQVQLKTRAEIICYLPILENKISRDGYRTGDIIETMDGTSVEVINTDAEGRMALADSILLAKKDKPDIIIDYATLTGTAIDALGGKMAAGFTNSKKLRLMFEEAGEVSGERVWGFPILTDIKREIENSTQADIKQTINSEDCDHIIGAAFLNYFSRGVDHIHIDLSCEFVSEGLGLIDTDVTGFGVFFTHDLIDLYLKS